MARYQARGQKYRYWYYQLKAPEAIFLKTNSENEYSRYQHLGSSGSEAHINGVLAVVRRVQIDELTKAIDGLKESWLDLYSDEKTVSNGETGFIYSPPYPKMPIQMKNPPSLLSKKEIQAIA